VWDGVGILQPPSDVPATGETSPSAGQTSASASAMDYFQAAKMDDFRAVPTESDEALAKFPPTLWITGTRSFDMSPVIVCHARFLKLGVDSYLYVMEGGPHGAYNIVEHMTP
jgi:monoterpene epsilon-lactone hydrolase